MFPSPESGRFQGSATLGKAVALVHGAKGQDRHGDTEAPGEPAYAADVEKLEATD
jgi:hypothetical protein